VSAPSASARLLFAFLAARGAFGLAYLIGSIRRSPIPWYYPLERRWGFGSQPAGFAMEWYGRTAVALLFAAVAFAVAWALAARSPLARLLARPSAVVAVARAVGLIMLVDFAYFGWILMHQTPVPLPLPLPHPDALPHPGALSHPGPLPYPLSPGDAQL
jgi:hypothetical protein